MKKGEVWQVRLLPSSGRVQAGTRPAVVVQNDPFLRTLPTVLVVPFTSNPAASRFDGTLLVKPDGTNGLALPSVALVFQLRAVDKRDLAQRLGKLDGETLGRILALVKRLAI